MKPSPAFMALGLLFPAIILACPVWGEVVEIFHPPRILSYCQEAVPLDRQDILERLDREFQLLAYDRAQVILLIKRSSQYFPHLEERLKTRRMPQDLKYLLVAESALKWDALSVKGAAGPWQFMEATGRRFQLRKDFGIDERYDYLKATEAALDYLSQLYGLFGSWALASAAYNCGEDRLSEELKEQGGPDYYGLVLPQETERYLFRILAAKIVLENAPAYGYRLKEKDLYPPLRYRTIELSAEIPIPMRIMAQICGVSFREIIRLNPQVRGYHLPPGSHQIRIPERGKKEGPDKLKVWLDWATPKVRKIRYEVHKGDTLIGIGKRFGISPKAIQQWNNLASPTLSSGQALHLYLFPQGEG
jgi:hypothetical protein